MLVAENIAKVLTSLSGSGATLVAVTKTHPASVVMEAYEAGQRIFGENKAVEMRDKHEQLPADIHWHMIGHLQTNKVKFIAPFVSLIHSVDSLRLLTAIDKEARKQDRVIDCLLQFHIAEEETKHGLDLAEAGEMLKCKSYQSMKNVRLCGVMGMATFTDNKEIVRREFRSLKNIFTSLKDEYFSEEPSFLEVSMGMSGDYLIALEEGSTMVRVGSSIFGNRDN